MTNNAQAPEAVELPVIQADDVLQVDILVGEGERLIALQIARLRIGYAMSLRDAALLANALARACEKVQELNEAEKPASAIIVPSSH